MKISIITIFPEYFEPLKISLLGKAINKGIIEVNIINLRDFADPPHFNVDDTPYGGGAGMVMRFDILSRAIDSVLSDNCRLIFTSAAGIKFTQPLAHELAGKKNNSENNLGNSISDIIFVCGRFEGYDERVFEYYKAQLGLNNNGDERVQEVSIGDYVLFGGEVAVLVMIEAVTRLIPGVVGNPESIVEESHELNENGKILLEYPNYTKPADFKGMKVPEVLLSGNHKKIREWRLEQSIKRTKSL
ncbi:MAG: tRNA (guanosine(37)-N1)-methyltransferase TrmD [Candidatus Ancillula sp.]|jgi:tRNA (guanine37-N1)-methyltransferase|nr:tRNA (guanosine(37)-N1)-methyltransferase TrmD [Candidatus Ancillula sp.]